MEVTKINIKPAEYSTKDTSATKEKSNKQDFNKFIAKASAVPAKDEKPEEETKTAQTTEVKASKEETKTEKSTKVEEINDPEEAAKLGELMSLLNQLVKIINNDSTTKEVSKEEILTSLKSKLSSTELTKLTTILEQLMNSKTQTSIASSVNKANVEVPLTQFDSILTEVKQELLKLINTPNTYEESVKSTPQLIKDVLMPEVKIQVSTNTNIKDNTKDNSGKKEDNFLDNLTTDGKTDKNSKVIGLMNQFVVEKNQDIKGMKEPNPINKNNLVNDVIKTLKFMETNQIKNLTVKINPKELGEITVNLTMEAGVMKATITAQNKDTYNLLQGNLQDMNSKIMNSEVKISNLSLNLYNEDTTFYNGNSRGENSNQGSNKREKGISGILTEEEDETNYDLNGNVNKFA